MNKLTGVTIVTTMALPATVIAALIEKGAAIIPAEDMPQKLDFDNIIPENTPWNSEGWDAPSGKKKAQWKSEVNGRKHK